MTNRPLITYIRVSTSQQGRGMSRSILKMQATLGRRNARLGAALNSAPSPSPVTAGTGAARMRGPSHDQG